MPFFIWFEGFGWKYNVSYKSLEIGVRDAGQPDILVPLLKIRQRNYYLCTWKKWERELKVFLSNRCVAEIILWRDLTRIFKHVWTFPFPRNIVLRQIATDIIMFAVLWRIWKWLDISLSEKMLLVGFKTLKSRQRNYSEFKNYLEKLYLGM